MGTKSKELLIHFYAMDKKIFTFVDRTHPGLEYTDKYDKCKDESILKFILVKAKGTNKYEFIKSDNCGQTRMTIDSKALQFFEDNRKQIMADSIIQEVEIDHTIFYNFREFKDGSLKTEKYFCKACVDWDEDKSIRERNQNLNLYKFFIALDNELSGLIK